MSYEDLKEEIKQVIKTNSDQQITGANMQATLLNIVTGVDENESVKLTNRLSEVIVEISKINTQLTEVDSQFLLVDDQLTGVDAQLTEVDSQFTEVDTRLTGVDTQLTEVDTRLTGVDAQLTEVDSQFTVLNTQLTEIDTQFTEVDSRLTGVDSQFTVLNTQLTEVDTQLTEVDTQLTEMDTQLTEIGIGVAKLLEGMIAYYGIEWDTTVSSSACTRIGRSELHESLPIQSRMRRCLLADDGTVATYLNATDSTKTDTGSTADLSGASGQVMVEIPAHYRKFEVMGTTYRCLLSEQNLPGFDYVPLAYRSAYEATVDRTTTSTPKLSSVKNTAAEFRGGDNNPDWDDTYRTLCGMPASSISLTNFRAYARNRVTDGTNWNCDVYSVQKACYWLYAVEYANFNSQLAYNAEPDDNGYKQGGLGAGVTTISSAIWGTYNDYNPFIPCGYTNSLGNITGVVEFDMPDEYTGTARTVGVPSYRGVENPFGHIWSWLDGCKCRIQSDDDGGLSEFFTCDDPANFQDTDYTNYNKRGELPRTEGYIKSMMIGEYGENMPTTVGGSSSTFFADYFYTNTPTSGEAQRGVLLGGSANYSSAAGRVLASTTNAATNSYANFGSRLCYLP